MEGKILVHDFDTIIQHRKGLIIDSVFVNGKRAMTVWRDSAMGEYLIIGFGSFDTKDLLQVETFYHGSGTLEPGTGKWGGVHNDGTLMYALGVGFSAPYISCTRHWLPCYDLPDNKPAYVHLTYTTDTSDVVASVGTLTSYVKNEAAGTHTYSYEMNYPIATYLITFALGPYERITTENPLNIPFETYAQKNDTAYAALLMREKVVPALVYFDSLFDVYPFNKIGYVITPQGSMEHQTMINLARGAMDTNRTDAVHELAHMWWGDNVTCFDFNDVWLNEGFARFCESLYLERYKGRSEYITRQRSNITSAINAGSTIPLYGTPLTTKPSSNYPTAVVYNKGAAVLGMLRYFIGDSAFFNAVRIYGSRYARRSATSYDLKSTFEEQTQTDMNWFFKRWVFGIGYPVLNIVWSKNTDTVTVYFEQTQNTATIGYFRLPFVIEARNILGQSSQHIVWMDSTGFSKASFTTSFIPDTIIVDPEEQVIKKINGQIRLSVDEHSVRIPTLSIHPNPARTSIDIRYASDPPQGVRYLLFDSSGDLVRSATLTDSGTLHHLQLDGLSSGIYTIFAIRGSQITGQGRFTLVK
jgi:hypothetical protein